VGVSARPVAGTASGSEKNADPDGAEGKAVKDDRERPGAEKPQLTGADPREPAPVAS